LLMQFGNCKHPQTDPKHPPSNNNPSGAACAW
jgi:hypothetical protein